MTPLALALWLAAPAAAQATPAVDLVPAGQPEELFLRAAQSYDDGRYAASVELYETLIGQGHDSAAVYYDLGNALLRGGALGRAIGAYRQAEARAPRDADIAANLTFARSSAKDAIAPVAPSPLIRTLLFWHHLLAPAERTWALLACHSALWVGVAIRIATAGRRVPRWLLGALAVPAVALGLSAATHALAPTRVAVVTAATTEVRAGTSHDAVVRFELHEGTEAAWVDSSGEWLRIALSDGKDGWIHAGAVTAVTLP